MSWAINFACFNIKVFHRLAGCMKEAVLKELTCLPTSDDLPDLHVIDF